MNSASALLPQPPPVRSPKTLAPPSWLLWSAAALFALGLSLFLDGPVDGALQIHSNPAWQSFAHAVTRLGEWWVAGPVGLALALAFFFQDSFSSARAAFFVTLSGLGTGLAATILRSLIGRARPSATVAPGFYGFWRNGHFIIGQYQFSSFPSGHAATLAGLAVAAWAVNRRASLALWTFTALVSWSRVAQSCHHFSDIVASCLLAFALVPCLMARLALLFPLRPSVSVEKAFHLPASTAKRKVAINHFCR